MRFMYVGDEPETVVFGITFKPGEPVEVTDEYAIRKLSANHLFVSDEGKMKAEESMPKVLRKSKKQAEPEPEADAGE